MGTIWSCSVSQNNEGQRIGCCRKSSVVFRSSFCHGSIFVLPGEPLFRGWFSRTIEEGGHFGLHMFDLIELEFWIAHDENFARSGVFVDEELALIRELGIGLPEYFFPLEHYCKDVAGVFGVSFVFLYEAAEEGFGTLFFDDLGLLLFFWRNDVERFPEREGLDFFAQGFPGFGGVVVAGELAVFLIKKNSSEELGLVSEGDTAVGAGVGAWADAPFLVDCHGCQYWG